MHLVPAERTHRRVIDNERVCAAIDALGDSTAVRTRAERFAVLGDPTRLSVLLCIHAAGPISVSDLAVAVDLNDTTVSQTLRFLRGHKIVTTQRDGRVIRYQLADNSIAELLTLPPPPIEQTRTGPPLRPGLDSRRPGRSS
ncbi:MAG: metalloregulator ArsR/SmtB family transcription factor [Actinomycetota bacterium]|nr:metalloregulator ArsR/SmtB family transcription factor [Actinomycetota bacterium]